MGSDPVVPSDRPTHKASPLGIMITVQRDAKACTLSGSALSGFNPFLIVNSPSSHSSPPGVTHEKTSHCPSRF
eukprot:6242591-Amphidinium_carterae.2